MYVYLRGSSILLLSTAEIALEKHADFVRALLYLKPGLPTLLKVSFRIFILRSISGPWHNLTSSICLHYYWREENISNYGLSDSITMRYNVVSFEVVANVPPRITAS